jgi:hypothetical protein
MAKNIFNSNIPLPKLTDLDKQHMLADNLPVKKICPKVLRLLRKLLAKIINQFKPEGSPDIKVNSTKYPTVAEEPEGYKIEIHLEIVPKTTGMNMLYYSSLDLFINAQIVISFGSRRPIHTPRTYFTSIVPDKKIKKPDDIYQNFEIYYKNKQQNIWDVIQNLWENKYGSIPEIKSSFTYLCLSLSGGKLPLVDIVDKFRTDN